MAEQEINQELLEFNKKLIESQKPLDPEFEKVLWDNYWYLLA